MADNEEITEQINDANVDNPDKTEENIAEASADAIEETPVVTSTEITAENESGDTPTESSEDITATSSPAETSEEVSPETSEETQDPPSETAEEVSPETSEETQDPPAETTEDPPSENTDDQPAESTEEPTAETTVEPPSESTEEAPSENADSAPVTESVETTPEKPKPAVDVDMTQEITVYHSSISCSQQVKKRQQSVEFILTSKKYNVKFIDLASIGESAKEEMRKVADDPKCLPPQIAKGGEYCGNYDTFMEAVEDGQLLQFLKLTQ